MMNVAWNREKEKKRARARKEECREGREREREKELFLVESPETWRVILTAAELSYPY